MTNPLETSQTPPSLRRKYRHANVANGPLVVDAWCGSGHKRGHALSATDHRLGTCRVLFAYRDETGLEADAIVEMAGGRWAAFEVKLGQREVDAAAGQLLRLRDRVDTDVAGDPIALVVVTATGYGYVRKDGVAVVPIGALGL